MAGFSNVAGMLDSVEMYVASTPTSPAIPWALATTTTTIIIADAVGYITTPCSPPCASRAHMHIITGIVCIQVE